MQTSQHESDKAFMERIAARLLRLGYLNEAQLLYRAAQKLPDTGQETKPGD